MRLCHVSIYTRLQLARATWLPQNLSGLGYQWEHVIAHRLILVCSFLLVKECFERSKDGPSYPSFHDRCIVLSSSGGSSSGGPPWQSLSAMTSHQDCTARQSWFLLKFMPSLQDSYDPTTPIPHNHWFRWYQGLRQTHKTPDQVAAKSTSHAFQTSNYSTN